MTDQQQGIQPRWIETIKAAKERWAKDHPEQPDIAPTVLAELKGEVRAVVVAPEIDKHEGLKAAYYLRKGFGADALTLVCDAHFAMEDVQQSETPDDAKERVLDTYKPGDMQRMCDEEGACKKGIITDCLICIRAEANGPMYQVMLPYEYDDKKQTGDFKWLPTPDLFANSKIDKPLELEGLIPDSLRKIMAEKTVFEEMPEVVKAQQAMGLDEERALRAASRATLTFLLEQGFQSLYAEDANVRQE